MAGKWIAQDVTDTAFKKAKMTLETSTTCWLRHSSVANALREPGVLEMANSSVFDSSRSTAKKPSVPNAHKVTHPGGQYEARLPFYSDAGLQLVDDKAQLTPKQVLYLQRRSGNRVVGHGLKRDVLVSQQPIFHGAIQRSLLSEDLERVWMLQDKEVFFARLGSLQECDPDVNRFVEQTLTGADLRRARRILGTDVPLSDVQRSALLTLLVSNLDTAENRYSVACQQVVEDIRAEQAAQVELLVALVTIGITYVVPGLGTAISRLANNIPASSSVTIPAVALGIQSRAGAIASAIGEAGKRAAAPAVRAALANSPRGFGNALIEGFGAAKHQIVSYITTNIQNRRGLSDEDLWVYVSNWDPTERTIAGYAENIRDFHNRWRSQVQAIGPLQEGRRSTIEQDRPYSTQVGVIWVQHSSGEVLVQATVSNGRLSFNRFIDADLKDMALARAATTQPRGIQSISWGPPYIFGMPTTVPRNVARR